jgi:hypothetical protein
MRATKVADPRKFNSMLVTRHVDDSKGEWIRVNVHGIQGGTKMVIDLAKVAGCDYSAGWFGGPMFIRLPEREVDQIALRNLIFYYGG